MNFAKTQHRCTKLRTALFAALVLSAPVLAATNDTEGALARNERAARTAIASSENAGTRHFADTRDGTLADNEHASKRVIFDTDAAPRTSAGAIGLATLVHNEYAAERAIVDGHAIGSPTDTAQVRAALAPVTTAVQPAAMR